MHQEYFIQGSTLNRIASSIRNKCSLANDLPLTIDEMQNQLHKLDMVIKDTDALYLEASNTYTNSNVSIIGTGAFQSCAIQNLYFPKCIAVAVSAFQDASIQYISLPQCKQIFSNAFLYCTALTSIYLPECFSIHSEAFYACRNLSSVYLPKCKIIGSSAFFNCAHYFPSSQYLSIGLQSINLPVCSSLGYDAFANCFGLKEITLGSFPSIVTSSFFSSYFRGCSNIKMTLSNCTKVSTYGFRYAEIKECVLPKCTTIGSYAFEGINTLVSVSLPNCTSIEKGAFESCYALSGISLPNCRSIDGDTFRYCSNLTYAYLPVFSDNVNTYASDGHFAGCYALASVYAPALKAIPTRCFDGCSALSKYDFTNITHIASYAFRGTGFHILDLPSNISQPGSYAFAYCRLLSTVYLRNVTYLQSGLFYGCSQLFSLYLFYSGRAGLWGSSVFNNTPIKTSVNGVYGSIYVPASLISNYQNNMTWSWYKDRFVAIPEE